MSSENGEERDEQNENVNRNLKEQKMKLKKKANADEPSCYYLIYFSMCLIQLK